jgi:hypothetical protein
MLECYVNLPEISDPVQNALSFACIHEEQQHNQQLLAFQAKYPKKYIYKSLDKDLNGIICHVHLGDSPEDQCGITLQKQI